jgi:ribosomal protein L11 methyltransferase
MLEAGCSISWEAENIPDQNWNMIWESNFDPITISNQCVIRAPFHQEFNDFSYQIIIEPKMSFGTGHHQTTRLMIEHMLELDFKDQIVLDMGCGTGILGILAALKNASKVVAVDIDKWAFENTMENAQKNNTRQITVLQGDTRAVITEQFDFILSNINRNILIEQMKDYSLMLKPTGNLLVSGILNADINSVREAAEKNRFTFIKYSELESWVAMMFERN